MAEEIERDALGGEDAARRAGDGGDHVARAEAAAVGALDRRPRSPDRSGGRRGARRSSPATTPGWRATSAVAARAAAGTMASVVMSPARPRSSSSAARTSGSIMMVGSGGTVMAQALRLRGRGVARRSRANVSASARRSDLAARPVRRVAGEVAAAVAAAALLAAQRGDGDEQADASRIGGRAVAGGQGRERGDGRARARRASRSTPTFAREDVAHRRRIRRRRHGDAASARARPRLACRRCSRRPSVAVAAASSSELLARRLAPCSPVDAASPQAHKPAIELRPAASTAMPPM